MPKYRGNVELLINGQEVAVHPPVREARELLTIRRLCLDTSEGCQIGRRDERLYHSREDHVDFLADILRCSPAGARESIGDFFRCYAGFAGPLYHHLQSLGYTVSVAYAHQRPVELPAPVLGDFELSPDDLHAIAEFATKTTHGTLVYGRGVTPAQIVAAVAKMYPAVSILLLVATHDDVMQLWRELRRNIRGGVSFALSADSCPESTSRVHVTTLDGVRAYGCTPEQRQILFLLNAFDAVSVRGREALLWAPRARVYGLLSAGRRTTAHDESALMSLLGPMCEGIGGHQGLFHRPRVFWVRAAGGSQGNALCDDIPQHCQALWFDRARARFVARIARDLARPNNDLFDAMGLTLRPTELPRVLVLVDGVRQAVSLARELRGWPVLLAARAYTADLPARDQALLADRRAAPLADTPTLICTAAALAEAQVSRCHVVVRADGGAGIPSPLRRLPAVGMLRPRVVVLDLDDRHPALRGRAAARRTAYAVAGWETSRLPSIRRGGART